MISAFVKGLFLSFSLVVPIGAQNVFVFNQALIQTKYRRVLPVILMTALCDALLILLAVYSIDMFLNLPWFKPFMLTTGILFLSYVGLTVWQSVSSLEATQEKPQMTLLKQLVFAVSVTLLNPHAIMDLFVIIGSISIEYEGFEKQAFIIGCIVMDFLWFFMLSMGGFHLKKIKHAAVISSYINKISAVIMWAIALMLTYQLFLYFQLGVL